MPTPSGVRKLTVNVAPQVADRLDEMARRRGITVTEVLRRAIAMQSIIDRAIADYGDLVIVRKGDQQPVHQLDAML